MPERINTEVFISMAKALNQSMLEPTFSPHSEKTTRMLIFFVGQNKLMHVPRSMFVWDK